jgi:hypothetical protein
LQPTKLMSRDEYLEFDLEVYPIGKKILGKFLHAGIVPQLGVIVGLTQEIVHSANSPFPLFDLKIKVIFKRLCSR